MRVGDGIVVRIPLLIRPGRAGAMQVHHETDRVVETGGHVQAVGANEASEIKPLRLAGNGPSTPGTDSGKARDHTKGRQRQMATTSDGQARSFHWRYWTATTTGALNYSETFTNRSTIRNG
jgi:hypothetical protein